MPQTKTKTTRPAEGDKAQRRGAEDYKRAAAAFEAPHPEPRKPTPMELRQNESRRQLDMLQQFLDAFRDMSVVQFEQLKTFKLILNRDNGCTTTPIEDFIVSLVQIYKWEDAKGLGMTLDQIAERVEDLRRQNVNEEIRRAHFMASRYPLPEPEAGTASE